MNSLKRRLIPLVAAGALTLGLAGTAAAHPPTVVTGGLVNVTIIDFLDVNVEDVIVQVPIAAAVNLCDVNAAVLLAAIIDTGEANCTADADSSARGRNN